MEPSEDLKKYWTYEQGHAKSIQNGLLAYLSSSCCTSETSQSILKDGLSRSDFEQILKKVEGDDTTNVYVKMIEQKVDFSNLKSRLRLYYNRRFDYTKGLAAAAKKPEKAAELVAEINATAQKLKPIVNTSSTERVI